MENFENTPKRHESLAVICNQLESNKM